MKLYVLGTLRLLMEREQCSSDSEKQVLRTCREICSSKITWEVTVGPHMASQPLVKITDEPCVKSDY